MTPLLPTSANAQTINCAALRVENGWSREEYRACRRGEIRQNIDQLDAEFAKMKAWLQARGLDVNEAGHITDPQGRTLAQIEASNAALAAGNADLAAGNADLAAGNAAFRAEINDLRLSIKTSRAEYQRILHEFEQTVLRGN